MTDAPKLTYFDVSGLQLIPTFDATSDTKIYAVNTLAYGDVGVHIKSAAGTTITLDTGANTYTSTTVMGVSDINERIAQTDGDSTYTITVTDDTTGAERTYTLNVYCNDANALNTGWTTESDKIRTQSITFASGSGDDTYQSNFYFEPYPFSATTYEYATQQPTQATADVTLLATPGDYQSTITWYYPYDETGVDAVEYANGATTRLLFGKNDGDTRTSKLKAVVTKPDGTEGQAYIWTFTTKKPKTPAPLTSLSIGSLTLTPTFDGDVTTYTATTTDATNNLTATVDTTGSEVAQIRVALNDTEVNTSQSGSITQRLTWETGENTVVVSTLWLNDYIWNYYTITVTKE